MTTKLSFCAGALWVALVALLVNIPGCTITTSPLNSGDTAGGGTGTPTDGSTDGSSTPTAPGDDGGDADSGEGDGGNGGVQSGTLTAGSFDDNLNLGVFRDFITSVLQSDQAGRYPNVALGQRIIVTVRDQQGVPIADARVVITPEGQPEAVLLDQVTGSDGRVLFLTGLDGASEATSFTVTVHSPAEDNPVAEVRDLNNLEWNFTLAAAGAAPGHLDLAFLVDTTGSMGDELEYLKTEMQSIARAVHELFPDVAKRYALILYRDAGDLYVVRPFDFTATLDELLANLADQSADGGGDWPEAVHLGLEEVDKLSWIATDTARVLFWVADAPPHTEFAERTFAAIGALRARTIAIYPVAASGVDTELEFYMRAAAFLTLSEYLFLTDDSGVGNPHAEPHVPCYHVQRLDQLIIRMIRAELSGARVEPDPGDIIRTVGNPASGVCMPEEDDANQQ